MPGRDPEHLEHPLEVAIALMAELDLKGARGGAVEQDGHAEQRDVLAVLPCRPWAPGPAHPTPPPGRRPFAQPVAHPAAGLRLGQRGLDGQQTRLLLQQRDSPRDGAPQRRSSTSSTP